MVGGQAQECACTEQTRRQFAALGFCLPIVDGAAFGAVPVVSGIGGIAGIAAFLRRRKSHTPLLSAGRIARFLYAKCVSSTPVGSKRTFESAHLAFFVEFGRQFSRVMKHYDFVVLPGGFLARVRVVP